MKNQNSELNISLKTAFACTDEVRTGKKIPVLLILILISVLPIALAYISFYTGFLFPKSTVNSGRFIDPAVSLHSLLNQQEWQRWNDDKKWRLAFFISNTCDESCQHQLYTSRQVHIRLDQRSKRVERVVFAYPRFFESMLWQALKTKHPRLKMVKIKNIEDWLAQHQLPENQYYLVDQQGMLMMAYNKQTGNELLKDIKRALKYSIDYQQ
ncbi:hypothetical protein [Agaribacterium haliotis]|uniref:hypothetical protein n=1 Tax=Agaribacterium haliotis TaxID=2013869 RepID=UPI000BB5474F|nr:hypothetical protein [Agaribacterium haliotis]